MRLFLILMLLAASPVKAKQLTLVDGLETCVELSWANTYSVPEGWLVSPEAKRLDCKSFFRPLCGMMKAASAEVYLSMTMGGTFGLAGEIRSTCFVSQPHYGQGSKVLSTVLSRLETYKTDGIGHTPRKKRFLDEHEEVLLCQEGLDPLLVVTPSQLDPDPMSSGVPLWVARLSQEENACEGNI